MLIAVGLVAAAGRGEPARRPRVGHAFAVPTYLFIAGIMVMIVHRADPRSSSATGRGRRERAATRSTPEAGYTNLTGLALLFFALRAFASGHAPR